jgi:hypothetical protein
MDGQQSNYQYTNNTEASKKLLDYALEPRSKLESMSIRSFDLVPRRVHPVQTRRPADGGSSLLNWVNRFVSREQRSFFRSHRLRLSRLRFDGRHAVGGDVVKRNDLGVTRVPPELPVSVQVYIYSRVREPSLLCTWEKKGEKPVPASSFVVVVVCPRGGRSSQSNDLVRFHRSTVELFWEHTSVYFGKQSDVTGG